MAFEREMRRPRARARIWINRAHSLVLRALRYLGIVGLAAVVMAGPALAETPRSAGAEDARQYFSAMPGAQVWPAEIDRLKKATRRAIAQRRRAEKVAREARESLEAPLYKPVAPWDDLADCEAGGHGGWALVTTGNGYWWALQFDPDTWVAFGGDPAWFDRSYPPPPAEQIAVAERVRAVQGIIAWPRCARLLGLI